jgi:hypothetical protein
MKLFRTIMSLFRATGENTGHQTNPAIDLAAAKVVYGRMEKEFLAYYNLWLHDKTEFFRLHHDKFKSVSQPEYVTHLSIMSSFGDHPTFYLTIDWRGEENEGEIQEFCEDQIRKTIHWRRADDLLTKTNSESQRDGKFILQLFTAIDLDLQDEGYRLVFKETNSDSYQFTLLRTSDVEALGSQISTTGYFLSDRWK